MRRLPCNALVWVVLASVGDQRLDDEDVERQNREERDRDELAQNFNLKFNFEVDFVHGSEAVAESEL